MTGSSSSSPHTAKQKKPITNNTSSITNQHQNNNMSLRRRNSFCCTTTYYNSPSSSSSSSSSSYMGSPFIPSTSSSIPFSWEKLPGVPKSVSGDPSILPPKKKTSLPLPPHLRSNSGGFLSVPRKKWTCYVDNSFVWDPFAVALEECCKDHHHWNTAPAPPAKVRARKARTVRPARFGFRSLEFYGSCKNSCSVEDSTVFIPLNRRPV